MADTSKNLADLREMMFSLSMATSALDAVRYHPKEALQWTRHFLYTVKLKVKASELNKSWRKRAASLHATAKQIDKSGYYTGHTDAFRRDLFSFANEVSSEYRRVKNASRAR